MVTTPRQEPSGYYRYELKNLRSAPQLRRELQKRGMSPAGVSALFSGAPLSNRQDVAIVGSVLAQLMEAGPKGLMSGMAGGTNI